MSRLPLDDIIHRYEELNQKLSQVSETKEIISLSREQKRLTPQYDLAKKIERLEQDIQSNQELLDVLTEEEREIQALTEEDSSEKSVLLQKLEEELIVFLTPQDPNDDKDIFLEIRAGAGGDESALFGADLLRMYTYLSEKLGFKIKVISFSENSLGGLKEAIAEIRGEEVYSWFKYEGGVHRVQRVPATEKQGRIHTSTVSVAVLPLIEEGSDFKLDLKDVEITASTSQGAGGQSVNTTYSAIKVKHIPTGIEAQSQDERNQQQNKLRALQVLTSRVFAFYEEERLAKEGAARREQVGKADRSEKIRTYNYPQDRITDHRYNLSWNQLPLIMDGDILSVLKDIKKAEAETVIESL